MTISESILPEFDLEFACTRRVLERVPDDKFDFKAHEKSNTIGWVASHLAEIPGWVPGTFASDTWDLNPVGGQPYQSPVTTHRQETLELFDHNTAAAREVIAEATDEAFLRPWSLLSAGETLFATTRLGVVRTWVLNHSIHHRAHLCVYLRLNDIPVPAVYGPSGDEQN